MPSAGVTNSYSTVAVVPEFPVSGRVVNANTGLYVCPSDKKAKIQGRMVLDAVGGDATYAIAVKRGASFFPLGKFVTPGNESQINGTVTMLQTDILTNIGDSGSTNGTADMDASVQEISL